MSQKEIVYLKGYAQGAGKIQTLKALNAGIILHAGQTRKTGEPYIYHPVRVASELLTLGVDNDFVLATAILHDTLEDCNIDSTILERQYGISGAVVRHVLVLSKNNYKSTEEYYTAVAGDWIASLVKISDRCHNISTMVGGFTPEKIHKYLEETYTHVIPLCKHVKNFYPEYSNQVFVMKYHIQSVCRAIEGCLQMTQTSSSNIEVKGAINE